MILKKAMSGFKKYFPLFRLNKETLLCAYQLYTTKRRRMKTFCSAMSKKSLDGDMIVLTDLLESEMSIQGKLIMADLVNGRVIVDTGDR